MDQKARKRKRRACDPCRKSKSRCEDAGSGVEDDPSRFIETQSTEPVRKRGPPKGYMSALEQRLNNAEAILGAVICSADPRAISLIADLSTDTLACSTLRRIREGEFGPGGRTKGYIRANSSNGSQNNSGNSPPNQLPLYTTDESLLSKLDSGEVFIMLKSSLPLLTHSWLLVLAEFDGPSLEWRDSLSLRLVLGSKNRESTSPQASSSIIELIITAMISEKEEDELLSDSDDIPMRDAEPVTISQTLRGEMSNVPQSLGTISHYTSRGLQYKDRPFWGGTPWRPIQDKVVLKNDK
ncbi:hypothetical protein Clacol_007730 [Clathrus columnatus]|uniref:Zn(2)-C6 fungal-type domain-containing protein n=1 Tax=Clathrus columnatus TaxID=1419009 RepID=A0AAV5AM12_9AGAM|nr:hypothetical protein Clacol_007730 [Clathrus columnatus]